MSFIKKKRKPSYTTKSTKLYFQDALILLLMGLPYCVVEIAGMLGELVDWSMLSTLGLEVVAAYGLFSSLSVFFNIFQKQVASNAQLLIAGNYGLKGKTEKEEIVTDNTANIITTGVYVSWCIDVVEILFIFLFHKALANLVSSNTVISGLLGNLLLLRAINLPAQTVRWLFNSFFNAKRYNKERIQLTIMYYITMLISDVSVLILGHGIYWIFGATILATYLYCVYAYLFMRKYGFRLGKFDKGVARELARRTKDTCVDRLAQRMTVFTQTLIVSKMAPVAEYAAYVVAANILDVYYFIYTGLTSSWGVYVSEWSSKIKEKSKKIYSKDKDIYKQLPYYVVVATIFQYLFFAATEYIFWRIFGKAVSWKECSLYMTMLMLQYVPTTLNGTIYNTLSAKGETKPLRYSAWIGGLCIRIPLQVFIGCILKLPLYYVPMANVVDFVIRSVYLSFPLRKLMKKEKNKQYTQEA